MLITFTFLAKLCISVDHFTGNRTHYPDRQPREGSANADVSFRDTGRGAVMIGFTNEKFIPNSALTQLQISTATSLDISLTYSSEIVNDCVFDGDIIIMDATEVGKYSSCLIDIYAWDFGFAAEIDQRVIQNGLYKNKLIAIPLEFYKSVLIFNKDILGRYGYSSVPADLASFTEMIDSIQVNERGSENYNLKGISIALGDKQTLVSWVTELTTGVGGFVFKDRHNTIATGSFSKTLDVVISWLKASIFDGEDFNRNWRDVLKLFTDQKVICIHADPSLVSTIKADFELGTASMPGLTLKYQDSGKAITKNGVPSGTIMGNFIGVRKNSSNASGALKMVNALTSMDYQRSLIVEGSYQREYLIPFHQTLLSDEDFCNAVGIRCSLAGSSTPALRPSTIAHILYPNATEIINTGILSIFNGNVNLGDGIEGIDDSLRVLLNFPSRNSTLDDDGKVPSKSSRFKLFLEQVLFLLLFVSIAVSIVVLYKKGVEVEKKKNSLIVPMRDLSETARLLRK